MHSSPVYFPSRRLRRKLSYFNIFLGSSLQYPQYLKLRLFRPKVHLPDVVRPEIKSIRPEDTHTLPHDERS